MYLIVGMAALGALIGLFVAWSASPLAQTALPLIFGLIGGASGFSVTQMDVTKPANISKLKLLGQTLAAFSLACIIGVVVGVAVLPKLIALKNPRHDTEMADKTPETIIERIILRKKLELAGASEDEIAHLLSLIEANATGAFQAAIGKLDTAIGLPAPKSETSQSETSQSGTRAWVGGKQEYLFPVAPTQRDWLGPKQLD
jgi:hypothetical protein